MLRRKLLELGLRVGSKYGDRAEGEAYRLLQEERNPTNQATISDEKRIFVGIVFLILLFFHGLAAKIPTAHRKVS